ncbi:hypothetical protein ABZV58_10435 [Nocardia sp. NPDC004654]|uniref:hypothetical protein n=1 Tax=Nocardia sp. NPDC004654 TaxID=3154776 RepID=UPI0033A9C7E3
MSPVVQQLLTLAAVVLGAGSTFSATVLIERTKWRRNLDTRWDDKRLAAYIDHASGMKKALIVCMRLAERHGYSAEWPPINRDAAIAELAATDAERITNWEALFLLGSPKAVVAAQRWNEAIWGFRHLALSEHPDHGEYVQLFETMGRLRNEFYDCARADLGVISGALTPEIGAWLREPPGRDSSAVRGSQGSGAAVPDELGRAAGGNDS